MSDGVGGVGVWLGCRSVCGAQCVAVVLVISRAGIGPKPKEVRANAGRKKGKKIVRVVFNVYDDKE